MKLLKKIIFTVLLGWFTMLSAQKEETKAKSILETVSKNYQSKKLVYFKFSYSTGSGKSAKNQIGTFYASKDKYKFKVLGNEQIFDGNKVYNINEEEQEITIAKPSANTLFLSPVSYLESYKKDHKVIYIGKKKNQEIIKITPMKNNGIKYVLLYINTAKKQVEKVEQYASNNTLTSINITEYKENLEVSNGLFSFNKNQYKNYLITEL